MHERSQAPPDGYLGHRAYQEPDWTGVRLGASGWIAVAILSAVVLALITVFLWKLVSMDFWHN